jgi:cysteine desulfurase/selenocysteine lyase
MENIRKHEMSLTEHAFNELNALNKVNLYCNGNPKKQGGIILFSVNGMDSMTVAVALDEMNSIAVRSGHHCAQPLISRFNENGLIRASFYLYNSKKEIDLLVDSLKLLGGN